MNGQDNLIPLSERTEEEKKKITSMGGKARAKAIQRRKTLKEELLLLLENEDTQNKISAALIKEALQGNNSGSVTKAFEVIRDTIGEKITEKVEVTNIDGSIKEVEEYINIKNKESE